MRWTDSPWFKSKWTAWICFTPIHGSRLKSHPYKIKKKRWSSWVGLRANNVDSIQYVQSVSTYGSIELFFFTEVVHPYLCRVILAGFSGSIYITEQLEYHYGFLQLHTDVMSIIKGFLRNSIHQTSDEYNCSEATGSYSGIVRYTVGMYTIMISQVCIIVRMCELSQISSSQLPHK